MASESLISQLSPRWITLRMNDNTVDLTQGLSNARALMETARYVDALELLVLCHQAALARPDLAGAFWSWRILDSAITHLAHESPESRNHVFVETLTQVYTVARFVYLDEALMRSTAFEVYQGGTIINRDVVFRLIDQPAVLETEARAWAAFYVGMSMRSLLNVELAVEWLHRSLQLARGVALIYELGKVLGNIYLACGDVEQAEVFFQVEEWAAPRLECTNRDAVVDASVNLFISSLRRDRFESARTIMWSTEELAEDTAEEGNREESRYVRAVSLCMRSELSYAVSQPHECEKAGLECARMLEEFPWKNLATLLEDYVRTGECSCSPLRGVVVATCMALVWEKVSLVRCSLGDYQGAAEANEKLYLALKEQEAGTHDHSYKRDSLDLNRLSLEASALFSDNNLEQAEETLARLFQLCSQQGDENSISYISAYGRGLLLASRLVYAYQGNANELNIHGAVVAESFLLGAASLSQTPGARLDFALPELAKLYHLSKQWSKAAEVCDRYCSYVMSLDEEFGLFSSGRISYLNHAAKDVFRRFQLSLLRCEPPEVRRAIVSAERERARDLIYGMKSRLLFRSETGADDESTWRDIVSVCKAGGTKTVFLVYTRFESELVSYLLHADEEPRWFIREVVFLRNLVHELQIQMAEKDVSNRLDVQERTKETMQELYSILIQPWSRVLGDIDPERLVVVPSEELSLVPFVALIDENGAHLVESYAVSYVSSLRLFNHCEERQRSLGLCESALVVGNPDGSLHHAELEARFVAEKLKASGLKRVRLLERPGATAEAVLEYFPRSEWVHVATHAVVNEKFPYGGILMEELEPAEPPHGTKKSLRERVAELTEQPSNVILTGRQVEVTDVQLRTLGVVLSACSTGLGEICSEGTLGLCRSLHSAGVTAVLVSLWDVNDEATMQLMEQFYAELSGGASVSSALQTAMKWMIRAEDQWEEPLYTIREWAAFTLSGSVSVRLTR